MNEQNQQEMNARTQQRDSSEKSLSMMASSLYKMQLGVNSIRDELKGLNDILISIDDKLGENKK